MKLTHLVALALAVFVTGCATTEPVVRYKYVRTDIPASLLKPCPAVTPPAKAAYLAADWPERERLLNDTILFQIEALGSCNADKEGLRKLDENQKAILKAREAAEL